MKILVLVIVISFSVSAFSDCCVKLTEVHDHASSQIDPDHHGDNSKKEDCHCFNICSHQVILYSLHIEPFVWSKVFFLDFPAVKIVEKSDFIPNIFVPPIESI